MVMNDTKKPKSTLVEIKETVSTLDKVFNKKRIQGETKRDLEDLQESIESLREYSQRLNKEQLMFLLLNHLYSDFNNSTLRDFRNSIVHLSKESKELQGNEKSFEENMKLYQSLVELFRNFSEMKMKVK